MLTRNFDNILTCWQLATAASGTTAPDTAPNTSTFTDADLAPKDWQGDFCKVYPQKWLFNGFTSNVNSVDGNCPVLVIGGSNEDEDYDAWNIGSYNSSWVTVTSHSYDAPIYDAVNKTWTTHYHKTFRASQNLTITNVGVFCASISKSGVSRSTMVYMKKLETPIELTTGQSVTKTFTTTVAANQNKPIVTASATT